MWTQFFRAAPHYFSRRLLRRKRRKLCYDALAVPIPTFDHILFLKAWAVGPGQGSLVHLHLRVGAAGVCKCAADFFSSGSPLRFCVFTQVVLLEVGKLDQILSHNPYLERCTPMQTLPRPAFSHVDCSYGSETGLTDKSHWAYNQTDNPIPTLDHILFLKARAVGPGQGSLVHLHLKGWWCWCVYEGELKTINNMQITAKREEIED